MPGLVNLNLSAGSCNSSPHEAIALDKDEASPLETTPILIALLEHATHEEVDKIIAKLKRRRDSGSTTVPSAARALLRKLEVESHQMGRGGRGCRSHVIAGLLSLISTDRNVSDTLRRTVPEDDGPFQLRRTRPLPPVLPANLMEDVEAERYYCTRCNVRKYMTKYLLKKHQDYECYVDPKFICPVCKHLFRHLALVEAHVKVKHPKMVEVLEEAAKTRPVYKAY